jgi:hypothetical protein
LRLAACCWLAASAAFAQSDAPPGMVRGDLLEWEAAKGAGEFSIRTAAHQVFRFSFDSKTYFERDLERCPVEKLQKGDLLEIVSDHAGPALAYARTVHVMERERPARRAAASLGRYRAYRGSADRMVPLGNLTFSGVVSRVNGGRVVLRTRREGEKTFLLREDTRYVENGTQVTAAELKANTRVFVRGAKNFEDDLEAYQVVWGEILEP